MRYVHKIISLGRTRTSGRMHKINRYCTYDLNWLGIPTQRIRSSKPSELTEGKYVLETPSKPSVHTRLLRLTEEK